MNSEGGKASCDQILRSPNRAFGVCATTDMLWGRQISSLLVDQNKTILTGDQEFRCDRVDRRAIVGASAAAIEDHAL